LVYFYFLRKILKEYKEFIPTFSPKVKKLTPPPLGGLNHYLKLFV